MFTNNVHRVSQSAFFIAHCHILFELILFGWIASIINLCVLILFLVTDKSSPFGISEQILASALIYPHGIGTKSSVISKWIKLPYVTKVAVLVAQLLCFDQSFILVEKGCRRLSAALLLNLIN